MTVAVFGGRFDPPHLGHYFVIRQILDIRKDIDKILLVPAFQHQWKPTVATGEQRMDMLQSFSGKQVGVSDIELQREGISYSIDTIKKVKRETNGTIYWVVGSDILSEFHRWERAEELVKEAKFLIFPRDPYHLPQNIPSGFEVIRDTHLVTSNLSSTIIRERVKNNLSIQHFVLPDVDQYIASHKFYR